MHFSKGIFPRGGSIFLMNSLGGEALDDVGIGCSKSFDGNGGSESEFCFGNELNVFRRFEFGCVMRVCIWDQSPMESRKNLLIFGPLTKTRCILSALHEIDPPR